MQKNCKFFATPFCNPLPPIVIPLWTPLMSHDPQLGSQLRCKNFESFLQPDSINQQYENLPPSAIPFWKPLITPDFNPHSYTKTLQTFSNPILQTRKMKTARLGLGKMASVRV